VSVKALDGPSRQAVAARVRYYRELGIYDLYRREVSPQQANDGLAGGPIPEEMSFGRALVRQELAGEEPVPAAAETSDVGRPLPMLQDKPAALRGIREEIGDCTRCKLSRGRTNIVFGVGNPQARIMFVGEGPGADEDAQGEPFVGRAGQLLNNMIQAMGLRREDVYIANVVKCRPPENRTPERDECETCGPFLMRQIAVVRPEIVVALGATAAKFLLGASDSMANLRGHLYDFHPILPREAPERDPGYHPSKPTAGLPGTPAFSTKLVVTYHPAYLLRDPRQKKEAWLDLQRAMKHLGMALPQRNPEG